MQTLEELQSKPNGTIDLEREQRRHEDWMRRGKKLFGKANAPLHILLQHLNTVRARNEACFEIADKPRMPVEPSSRQATPEDGIPISDGSNSSRDVFCICRKAEAGMMIECELCHEWYHGKCLKIARGKVKEDDKYTCPICDYRLKIPRDATRPRLEDLTGWLDEVDGLPFQPEEDETLNNIIDDAQNYREFIKPIIHSDVPTTPEEVDTMRFHLRKIEGADLLLVEETNFLRQELHKWAPVAPDPPPIIQHSSSTRKPRPTKQQKIMAQLGITDPEMLPHEYKIKYHITKKKEDEPVKNGAPPPLQPANSASPTESQPSSAKPKGEKAGEKKPFYTPLALHVLGPLAAAPVVSQMLSSEPHMNRDKLYKMKAVLENDRDVWSNLEAFRERMNSLPRPSTHSPGFGYETAQDRAMVLPAHRDSALFQTAPSDVLNQPPRLGSPAHFGTPPSYQPDGSPPNFDTGMFHGPPESMFDSPADAKPGDTSPDFGDPMRIFDSPKPSGLATVEVSSPGFGGSQQSAGTMDHVFADLVHDHDTIGGLDGSTEAKDKIIDQELTSDAAAAIAAMTSAHDTQLPDTKTEAIEGAVPKTEDELPVSMGNVVYHGMPQSPL